jgi:hypothetical protein
MRGVENNIIMAYFKTLPTHSLGSNYEKYISSVKVGDPWMKFEAGTSRMRF